MARKITAAQVGSIGNMLATLAGVWNPVAGASIAGIVKAATKLNTLVSEIKSQTAETHAATWAKVSADYNDSLAGFVESVKAQQQPPQPPTP